MMSLVRRKVVNAKVTNAEKRRYPSKHYVYIIQVTWDDGSDTVIFRRYSKFFDFQIALLESFPVEGGLKNPAVRTIPFLPGKILFRRSHVRDVAMKRLKPIDEYVNELLQLPPHISQSEQVLNFFESRQEDLHPPKEETSKKKKKDEQDISEISGPILLEQYIAISDYTRTQPKEVTVTSGQMLEVIEKHENGWWFVSDQEGERGWVPGVYLEKRDGTTENLVTKQSKLGQGEKYVTTVQFTGGKDEVSFGIGVLVEVLQKNLEGWWLISYQGKQGWAPASYLEKPAEALLRQTSKADANPSFKSSVENRRSLPADAVQAVFPLNGAAYNAPPSNALNSRKHLDLTRTNSNPLFANRKKLTALPPTRPQPSQTRPPPKKSSVKRASLKPVNPPPLPPSPAVKDEPVYDYFTSSSFNANIPHGISFQQDKKVKVLEKSPGDWWYISLEGEEGWAPASHITRVFHKEKLRQPPHRPKRPTSCTKPSLSSTRNDEEQTIRTKSSHTVNPSVEKSSSSENGPSKPCLPGKPLPLVPLPQKTNGSSKNISVGFEQTKYWKTNSASGNQRNSLSGKNDIHRNVERSTSGESNSKSAIKPAVDKLHPDRKAQPPRPPIKPATIPAKPKPITSVIANTAAKEVAASKKKPEKPRPPSLPSKKPPQTAKETQPKGDSDLNGNCLADFRSVLKPAQKKVITNDTTLKNGVEWKKKPLVVPEKPSKPDLPATKPLSAKLKPAPATTKKNPAFASRPKVPVSKPKPGRPTSKPVLKRFQIAEEQKNLNGNNNSAEENEKSLVVVNRVEVEQIVPNAPLPFNLRGIPDGQVDGFKAEDIMKTSGQNTSCSNIMPVADDRKHVSKEERYIAMRDFTPEDDNEMGFAQGSEAILIQKSINNWWYMKINGKCGWVPSAYFKGKLPASNDKASRNFDDDGTANPDVGVSDTSALANRVTSDAYQETLYDSPESLYSEIEEPSCQKAQQSQNVCELYKAGSGFEATDNTMISLAYGDIVQLMHRADTGWWFVKVILSSINSMDQEGWVPADYLDKL